MLMRSRNRNRRFRPLLDALEPKIALDGAPGLGGNPDFPDTIQNSLLPFDYCAATAISYDPPFDNTIPANLGS
jgi:hypothetical protein